MNARNQPRQFKLLPSFLQEWVLLYEKRNPHLTRFYREDGTTWWTVGHNASSTFEVGLHVQFAKDSTGNTIVQHTVFRKAYEPDDDAAPTIQQLDLSDLKKIKFGYWGH